MFGEFVKSTQVCFSCRKAVKSNNLMKCPNCKQEMRDLGNSVKVPRRSHNSGWKQLEILYFEAKRTFRVCCGHAKTYRVTTIGEAKAEVNRKNLKERVMSEFFKPEWYKLLRRIDRKNWESVY